MMKNFQIILLIIFGAIGVFSVLVFSGLIGGDREGESELDGTVVMWGSLPRSEMRFLVQQFVQQNENYKIDYVEKTEDTFEQDLIEALALGEGPDIILFPHDLTFRQADKLIKIPYDTVGEREFLNNFIDSADIFLSPEGIIALPFAIDPLVLYWNKSMFQSAAIANPPEFWSDFFSVTPLLTRRDERGQISQSAIPLGESGNILHQKDILSAMFMQTGDNIVEVADTGPRIVFSEGNGAASVLRFYTEFSDANKNSYTWNSSLPASRDAFAAEKSATYIGPASERDLVKELNPHLDFGMELLPQIKDGQIRSTYGNIFALGIISQTEQAPLAFAVIDALTFGNSIGLAKDNLDLVPVQRSLLGGATDEFSPVLDESAIISRVWLDPHPERTSQIFKDMIDRVVIRKSSPEQAVSEARTLITNIFTR